MNSCSAALPGIANTEGVCALPSSRSDLEDVHGKGSVGIASSWNERRRSRTTSGLAPVLQTTRGKRRRDWEDVTAPENVNGSQASSRPCRALSHQNEATVKTSAQAAMAAAAGSEVCCPAATMSDTIT